MAWPSGYPPAGDGSFTFTKYELIRSLWEAIRERYVAAGGDSAWPPSTYVWRGGSITNAQDDSGGAATGHLRFTDDTADDDGLGWVDGSGIKRWTAFAGTFNGHSIDPTPGSFKLVIFPPDDGSPPATSLGDPKNGFVLPIVDNGDTWVEVADDGELFLNGLSIDAYIGFRYQIIRNGTAARQGYGFPDRYPFRSNYPELHYGEVTDSGTGYITDDRDPADDRWHIPHDFTSNVGKDAIFQDGDGYWQRVTITAADTTGGDVADKFTFSTITGTAPTAGTNFWIVEPGKFWRPRCRLGLERKIGRRGRFWKPTNPGGGYWFAWWNATLSQTYASHQAYDDTIGGAPIAINKIHLDDGTEEGIDVQVFDFDGTTGQDATGGQDDAMFNPRIAWSYRGLQLSAGTLLAAADWVEPKNYDGAKYIELWTAATWFKYFLSANTRTATIGALVSPTDNSSATVSFSAAVTLPNVTTAQGAYTDLPCEWTLLDPDGQVISSGQGTMTSTELTQTDGTFIDNPPPPDGDGNSQVGFTLVMAFCAETGDSHDNPDLSSWTRKYPRMVKHLYPRTVWIPDDADDTTPTEAAPGTWIKQEASTSYAEFSKFGKLEEIGHTFIEGELAIYVGDNFEDPTTDIQDATNALVPFYDAYYQGRPNVSPPSSWPRWEGNARKGVCTAAGNFFIEDSGQNWWRGTTPLVGHSGTADPGSTADYLTDTGKHTNGFWMQADRFKDMVCEVELDPSGAPGIYDRRPITAYDSATQKVSWAPPFPSSTANKNYKIREPAPGGTGGAILNLWEDRRLKVTSADGTSSGTTFITHSDDIRIYFDAGSLGFTPAAGDVYVIEQHEPGAVHTYDPSDDNALISGWAPPEGVGTEPTVVTAFGRYRKRDYLGIDYWQEIYKAIDSLRWIRRTHTWSSRSPSNYLAGTPETNAQSDGTADFLAGPSYDSAASLISRMPAHLGENGTTYTATPGLEDAISCHTTEADGTVPQCEWTNTDGGPFILSRVYAYGVTDATTINLKSSFDFYVAADEVVPDRPTGVVFADVAEFNDCGTGLTRGEFKKWTTLSADDIAEPRTSASFGVGATPPTVDNVVYDTPTGSESGDPAPPFNSLHSGYKVTRWWAIEQFDVTSGLTYRS